MYYFLCKLITDLQNIIHFITGLLLYIFKLTAARLKKGTAQWFRLANSASTCINLSSYERKSYAQKFGSVRFGKKKSEVWFDSGSAKNSWLGRFLFYIFRKFWKENGSQVSPTHTIKVFGFWLISPFLIIWVCTMYTVQCCTLYNVQCIHCIYIISLLFSFYNCAGQKTCVNVVNNGNIRMPFKHYILNILSSNYCSVLKFTWSLKSAAIYADTIFITIDT